MKRFLVNLIYKIFIVVTFPIAVMEIFFKNLWYGLQLSYWDLKDELKFVWGAMKWGVWHEERALEEYIKRMKDK